MWLVSVHLTQATGQVLRKAGAARGRESGGVAPPPAPPGLRWVLSPRLHPCPQVLSPSGVTGCTHLLRLQDFPCPCGFHNLVPIWAKCPFWLHGQMLCTVSTG